MPPVIDIIRSAETSGNASEHDPDLTIDGEYQASRFRSSYAYSHKITHIVSSPMRRCIRTAIGAFGDILLRGKRILLLPEIQDTGTSPSDTGHPPTTLERWYGPYVDTSMLDSRWCDKGSGSEFAAHLPLVEERARQARVFLRELAQSGPDNAHIVVFTHGRFAHFLTNNYSGVGYPEYTTYQHATMRSFEFVDLLGDDSNAEMIETEDSLVRSQLPRFEDLEVEQRSCFKMCAVMGFQLQRLMDAEG